MNVAFLPGFLWMPGDEEPLVRAGLSLDVVPLPALAAATEERDRLRSGGDRRATTAELLGGSKGASASRARHEHEPADVALAEALGAALAGAEVVVGYSMGARVLLSALAAGLRLRTAVLLSLSATAPEERAARSQLDDKRADELLANPCAFLDAWAALPLFRSAARHDAWQAQQARRRSLTQDDAAAHARSLRRFSSGTLRMGTPGRIHTPLTLVVGSLDAAAVEVAQTTVKQLPNASLTVLAGCGHVLPLEAPAAVASLVMTHLATLRTAVGQAPLFGDDG
jgi:pimeloyl-ACP methyl ester carboxylesterase